MTIPNQRRRMAMEARSVAEHTGIEPDDDRVAKAVQAAAKAVGVLISDYRLTNAHSAVETYQLETLEIEAQNAVVRAASKELNADRNA